MRDERPDERHLRLTSLVGRRVLSASGHRVGWVRDLVADLGSAPVPVTGVVVGDFHGRWTIPWAAVGPDVSDVLRCADAAAVPPPTPATPPTPTTPPERPEPDLDTHQLMLVRDVLDSRVYGVTSRRSARVGDVWLTHRADGRLEVAGLEVGTGVVLGRLGLRPRHDFEESATLLPLSDVHLTSARGHQVQLATPTSPVHRLDPHELAHLLTHLPVTSAADVVRHLPAERADAAARHLHPHVLSRLAHALSGRASLHHRRVRRTAGWRLNRPAERVPPRDGRRE